MVLNHKVQGPSTIGMRATGRSGVPCWHGIARSRGTSAARQLRRRSFQFDKEGGHTIEDETVAPDRCDDAGGLVFHGSSD
jgi:hypothetical protein